MLLMPVAFRVCDPELIVSALEGAERVADIPEPRRVRTGGKPAADRLLRSVKPTGKRADFLRWFLEDESGRTVGATMAKLGMNRPNVLSYWTMIHRDHGIGYTLSNNTIAAILPAGCDAASVFGGPHGA